MVLIPLILNYGINTNAMEIARFALDKIDGCMHAQLQPEEAIIL